MGDGLKISLDDTTTSRTAFTGLTFPAIRSFGCLGVFFVDNFLRLDCHMYHVGSIFVELAV
jgi:hypothetical protein